MFYSQSLLSRHGSLGDIWMAAFCFKKLKKHQIAATDISSSIDAIMPEVQIPYRVLAQLLLGIVKIFSKKVDYLYHDCNVALNNIRKSFTPIRPHVSRERGIVPIRNVVVPKEVTHAPYQNISGQREAILTEPVEAMCATYDQVTITVPERFELDAFNLQLPEEGDSAEHNQQFLLEDQWTIGRYEDETNEGSLLNECYERGRVSQAEFDLVCFTPVDDILSSHMMDIDLEICEAFESDSVGVRREILERNTESVSEYRNHEIILVEKSLYPTVRVEETDHHVHKVKLQEKVPSDLEKQMHVEKPENQILQIKLPESVLSNHEEHVTFEEKHTEATTPSNDKPPGHAPPKFMVTTPAKKEQLGITRKRKNFFDESIVLSNEILRRGIHDASSLVCKRRKAPHTNLDAWRAYKFTNFHQSFLEPLLPCTSVELKTLFQKKCFDHSALRVPEKTLIEPVSIQDRMHDSSTRSEDLLNEKISVDTRETPSPYKPPPAFRSQESQIEESSLELISRTVPELDLMEVELGFCETETDRDNGWSIRTRAVAKYLYDRLDLQEEDHKGILSLACIVEGQTRKNCARFFYETLTLKCLGCIDVRQDSPYGDIIISLTSGLEIMFKDQ